MGKDKEKGRKHSLKMKGKNRKGENRICKKCGKKFYVQRYALNRGWGKYCSKDCSKIGNKFAEGKAPPNKGEKMSDKQKKKLSKIKLGKTGVLCNAWKGGLTIKNTLIRESLEGKLWKKAIYQRDNFTCQKTKQRGGKLEAHHINNFAQFPELRFAIDNGITLSKTAHKEFHSIYGKKNNTPEQLKEFLVKRA